MEPSSLILYSIPQNSHYKCDVFISKAKRIPSSKKSVLVHYCVGTQAVGRSFTLCLHHWFGSLTSIYFKKEDCKIVFSKSGNTISISFYYVYYNLNYCSKRSCINCVLILSHYLENGAPHRVRTTMSIT